MAPEGAATFQVRFDEQAIDEDLEHASAVGRTVAEEARAALERDGIVAESLHRCQAEGRDGTRLGGCVKTYLPAPAGDWGMVFSAARAEDGSLVLVYLAFGRRHPAGAWRPSVYEVAHRRLHGTRA